MFQKLMMWSMMIVCMLCMGIVTFYTIAVQPQQKMVQQVAIGPATALSPQPQTPPQPAHVHILSAARSLRTGSLLHAEDFSSLEFAPADVPGGAQIDSPANRQDLAGALVRHAVGSGQAILQADIIRPGDHGFLALALSPGKRAVSIGVDMLSGVADLISPGDMVDVLLTQTIKEFDAPIPTVPTGGSVDPNLMLAGIDQNAPKIRRTCSEAVLGNLRVIAIDQDLTQGGRMTGGPNNNSDPAHPDAGQPHQGRGDPGRGDPGRGDPGHADPGHADQTGLRTVTLELAQDEAQQLEIVRNAGRLSLAVVSSDPAPGMRTASLVPVAIQISAATAGRKVCRDVLVSPSQRVMKPL
jgi:pilus assembly protein CpaB